MEDIIEYFQYPTIPKVIREPTQDKIKDVQEKIYENKASVPCKLGRGKYSYLGIAITNNQYLVTTGKTFILCTNPLAIVTYLVAISWGSKILYSTLHGNV
jgi:hypothetical protein